jgi:heterodisulfide reductase subunit A-like polyferredoxin/coenzyme F420-reducing hydrogenase delta subunit
MNASKPNVLILGGGVAGLAAAQALEDFGVSVDLVEKSDHLGGRAYGWACMATETCRQCGACLSAELADQVGRSTNATVHLNSTLEHIRKTDQGFEAVVKGASGATIGADAVLVTTGMQPFDPSGNSDLGYGTYKQVITTADLNTILKQERLVEILPQTPCPSIAFIQCVGSRDRQSGRDYCSQVCCKTAVRHANKLLHLIPEADITVFHIDLQVIGKVFRTQTAAMQARVNLLQGVPARIFDDREEGKLTIIHENAATGARTALHFDLIVLAVGIQPSLEIGVITDQLGVPVDQWGFLSGNGGLPPSVYSAGAAQGPTDIVTAREQGIVAARQIAADLGQLPGAAGGQKLAIIGGSPEADALARSLVGDGHTVTLLDSSPRDRLQEEGLSHFTAVQLRSVSGTLGHYRISFAADGELRHTDAAGVVIAAGVEKEPAMPLTDSIVPLGQFADAMAKDPENAPPTVIFWLDRNGPEWKAHSRDSLVLAADLAARGKRVYVMMEKMLVHGLNGQRLYDTARRQGVRFMRVEGPDQVKVTTNREGLRLAISEATLPGVDVTLECDLLVIPEKISSPVLEVPAEHDLRLNRDEEGFLQSANVRHRSVGSPRRGIFFLGSCHDETDQADIEREIAAIKASLARVTPQPVLDAPPTINEGLCGRCLTCYRACPHAAVIMRNEIQPKIVPEACFACGICVSSCPARAIQPDTPTRAAELKAAAGGTVIFACQRSAALAIAAAAREAGVATGAPDYPQVIAVTCAGQIDEQTLLQPLLDGAATVIIAGCHDGNCRSMTGSRTAGARVKSITAQAGLSAAEVSHLTVAANEPYKMARVVTAAGSQKEESHA